MLARLRDLLTGFLVMAVAFGVVDRALRRPVAAGPAADDASETPPEPGPAPGPTGTPAEIEERLRERGTTQVEPLSAGSGLAMAILAAAPIVVAVAVFAGRENVPLGARILVALAVLAVAGAVGALLIARPISSRHVAIAVAAIGVEMVAVTAAIAIDAAS